MPRKREYEKYKSPGLKGMIFPRSIGRAEYFIRSILVNVLIIFPLAIVIEQIQNPFLGLSAILALICAYIAVFWVTIVPRLRDLKWNTKLAWLCLIPGINVIMALSLLFTPGK